MMENIEEIFKEVDNIDSEKIMDLMRTVININTTLPPGKNYREFVDAVKPYFENLGYGTEEVVVPEELIRDDPLGLEGPRINLVATKDFGQHNDISFYAHMDVVPAPKDGNKKWRFDPFEATLIKGGKIFGRGTSDMKGTIVCIILSLEIIEKLKLTPKYDIRVMLCTDEEGGQYQGVRYLEENGYVKGSVFCMETVIMPIQIIGFAGSLNVIVKTLGKSAHSGANWMGVNALEEMVPILDELMELKHKVEARESKNIPGRPPNPGSSEKQNLSPMFNLDIIQSGTKANIVPDLCTLTINRRYIPDEKIEDVKQEIQDAIDRGKAKSKALEVTAEYISGALPVEIDPDSPTSQRLKNVMSYVQNRPLEKIFQIGVSGGTDMGFVTNHEIIFHGLGNAGSNMHGVNESVKLKDVKTYIKELIVFLCAEF